MRLLERLDIITCCNNDFSRDLIQTPLIGFNKIYSIYCALAAFMWHGCVMIWIDEDFNDDSSSIQMKLWDDKIHSTRYAFAAVPMAGSLVIWDSKDSSGDLNSVQMAILSVDRIYSKYYAFAAVLKDANVLRWVV